MAAVARSRVLVVDDEVSLAKIMRKQLEVSGFEVLVASDGEEALVKARELHPDLMVLDMMLPKLSGLEVCATMKQDAELRRIPILMVTARAKREDCQTALKQGADAYLAKPFELEDFVENIKRLLSKPTNGHA